MAAINWVTEGLPTDFALPSGSENTIDNFVDDPAATGSSRRRKIFTRTLRQWPSIKIELSSRTVVESLDNFYHVTTKGGVLPFDFPRPRPIALNNNFQTVEVRFIKGSFGIQASGQDAWDVTFGVEEI